MQTLSAYKMLFFIPEDRDAGDPLEGEGLGCEQLIRLHFRSQRRLCGSPKASLWFWFWFREGDLMVTDEARGYKRVVMQF
jgi:hypothetical protein